MTIPSDRSKAGVSDLLSVKHFESDTTIENRIVRGRLAMLRDVRREFIRGETITPYVEISSPDQERFVIVGVLHRNPKTKLSAFQPKRGGTII